MQEQFEPDSAPDYDQSKFNRSDHPMTRIRGNLHRLHAAIIAVFIAAVAQAQSVPAWQPYDESADLALLAQHANASMRFKLLNSRMLDKNTLWAPFADALNGFSEQRYEALQPLVLNRSVTEIQQAISRGELNYEELTTFYIHRIRQIETDNTRYLNAIISLNPDAIARARMLDQLRAQGTAVAQDSLFGMPVLLKDNIGFSELPTTAGAIALKDNVTASAFITERLLAQGAVILGKANLSEWAYFFCSDCPSGYSAMGGQTLNPYGRFAFSTGGSSAGSGAAVAADYATIAVGSETSGSILSPSSANSLVGLKPTTGSLSRTGIVPISATLDTAGPMARTVADVVILFNALAGFDDADTAMPMLSADYRLQYRTVSLAGKRLGVLVNLEDNPHYAAAINLLAENGATLVPVELTSGPFPRFSEFLGAEMRKDLQNYLTNFASTSVVPIASINTLQAFNLQDLSLRAPYGQALVDMMAEGQWTTEELDVLRAEMQTLALAQMDQLFADRQLDVLLSINNASAQHAALANYPALTVPTSYEENGRPAGLTLIAPAFSEQVLIDIGATFEALRQARLPPSNYER